MSSSESKKTTDNLDKINLEITRKELLEAKKAAEYLVGMLDSFLQQNKGSISTQRPAEDDLESQKADFINEIEDVLNNFLKEKEAADSNKLAALANRFAGDSGLYGFSKLSQKLRELEQAAKIKQTQQSLKYIDEIMEILTALR